jgi:pantoate--beta-alanine ligase
MTTLESVSDIRVHLSALRSDGATIAFVPTMGYLHAGHMALVERARTEADHVVASIFVNPTQFAPGEDLSTYPRDPEGDSRKLSEAGCDLLYLPRPEEIYPASFSTFVTVGGVADLYEGAHRPTHFRGVATVVAKFFNILAPDAVVFGQKDAQQVAVIRRMMRDLNYGIRLAVVDTVREPDGLAMSSRNVYLSADDRTEALSISRGLFAAREAIASGAPAREAERVLRAAISPAIAIDYADVINADAFAPAADGDEPLLAVFAGRVGRTRLIDNLPLPVPVAATRAAAGPV